MGGHIHLEILPTRIDPVRWAELYDESLALLRRHPSQPMSVSSAGDRTFYTRALEKDAHDPARRRWEIVGDMASMATGEPFSMGRALPAGASMREDLEIAAHLHDLDRPTASVFCADTFGRPYHQTLLAICALIEAAAPDAAIVRGDFDTVEARLACAWASAALGRRIRAPIVTRPKDLYWRLARHHRGDDLLDLFTALCRAPEDLTMGVLESVTAPERWRRWRRRPAQSAPAPAPEPQTDASVPGLQALMATHDLDDLHGPARLYLKIIGWRIARIIDLDPLDPFRGTTERLRAHIERAARANDLTLSEDAWDDLDAAGDEDLRFALALLLVDARNYGIEEARRALLENATLRRSLQEAALDPHLSAEIGPWIAILS